MTFHLYCAQYKLGEITRTEYQLYHKGLTVESAEEKIRKSGESLSVVPEWSAEKKREYLRDELLRWNSRTTSRKTEGGRKEASEKFSLVTELLDLYDLQLIESLGLTRRSKKMLYEAGIHSVEQLEGITDKQLLDIPGIGPKTLSDIQSHALHRSVMGICLYPGDEHEQ